MTSCTLLANAAERAEISRTVSMFIVCVYNVPLGSFVNLKVTQVVLVLDGISLPKVPPAKMHGCGEGLMP